MKFGIHGILHKKYQENMLSNQLMMPLAHLPYILPGEHPDIKPIRVVFDESIDISRVTQITYCKATLEWLTQTYGINFYSHWTFFTVTNSHFIKWLSDESYDFVNNSFTHFVFLGSNYLVEIVAGYEPTIIFE